MGSYKNSSFGGEKCSDVVTWLWICARPDSKFVVRRGIVFERCAGFELLCTLDILPSLRCSPWSASATGGFSSRL
jgi:hypothetical protein